MKYIKAYENLFTNYSVGDIVIVHMKLWSTKLREKKDYHAIFVINDIIGNIYQCYEFDIVYPVDVVDINDCFYFKEEDIVEKISKEDAELLLTSQKYNL